MNSNLPPGCTLNDIEQGTIATCEVCGREVMEEKIEDGVCPRCRRDEEEE